MMAKEPTSKSQIYLEKLSQLEQSTYFEQKQKIFEMNVLMDEMKEEELESVLLDELFNEIHKMIEEKKLSMENAILLLNYIGYLKILKRIHLFGFEKVSLGERIEKMIAEENLKKKEEKNEKLLIDLCECYISLYYLLSPEIISICVPCLLKVALKKEENEKTQKEAEMALLALGNIKFDFLRQELYLNDTKEIIKHHQEYQNLTRLAYQSAWQFFIYRFSTNGFLEDTIVNELHFAREAARELEYLTRNEDWNRKKGEEGGKETKEEFALVRWLQTFSIYFQICRLKNEENVELISSIAQIYRAAKGNNGVICNLCISSLRIAVQRRVVKVEDLLNGGAVDTVLEEMQRPKLNKGMTNECFQFFLNVSKKLKQKNKDEREEEERKATKRKIFEKMEEEGYEDTITSFHGAIDFLCKKYHFRLSLNISNYFVNI